MPVNYVKGDLNLISHLPHIYFGKDGPLLPQVMTGLYTRLRLVPVISYA